MPQRQQPSPSWGLCASLILTVLISNGIVFLAVTAAARAHSGAKQAQQPALHQQPRGQAALLRRPALPAQPPSQQPQLSPRSMITEQACYTRSDESGEWGGAPRGSSARAPCLRPCAPAPHPAPPALLPPPSPTPLRALRVRQCAVLGWRWASGSGARAHPPAVRG